MIMGSVIYRILIILTAVTAVALLSGCTPRLLGSNIVVNPSLKPATNDMVAVISNININWTNQKYVSRSHIKTLKESVRNAVQNSGIFQKVYLDELPPQSETMPKVYFDIVITPLQTGKLNLWIAWPAVYPMPCYWPFQPKKGDAKVTLKYRVKKNNIEVDNGEIIKTEKFSMLFYGFFRVRPVEAALSRCYRECLLDFATRIESQKSIIAPTPVARQISSKDILKVAVVDLESKGFSEDESSTLTDKLRTELINTGRFQVMERNQMDEILKEQGFQQTGCTSQNCMVEMGQLIGVEYLIGGHVGKVGDIYIVSLRIIDVAKGTILVNVSQEVRGTIIDLVRKGIQKAANKLANAAY
jgi:TolB-like protein